MRCGVYHFFLGGWGIMLAGDFDDVDVAHSSSRC